MRKLRTTNTTSSLEIFLMALIGLFLIMPLIYKAKIKSSKHKTPMTANPSSQKSLAQSEDQNSYQRRNHSASRGQTYRHGGTGSLASRSPASLESTGEPEPGDYYYDEGAYSGPSESDMALYDVQEPSHLQPFDSIHRQAQILLQNMGLNPSRMQIIDQQGQLIRSEIQAISLASHLEPAQAQQMIQVSMQKYYNWMAQQLGPEMYSYFINRIGHM